MRRIAWGGFACGIAVALAAALVVFDRDDDTAPHRSGGRLDGKTRRNE